MDSFVDFIISSHTADIFTWNVNLETEAKKHNDCPSSFSCPDRRFSETECDTVTVFYVTYEFHFKSRWNFHRTWMCQLYQFHYKSLVAFESGIDSNTITSPFWNITSSHHRPWNSLIAPTRPLRLLFALLSCFIHSPKYFFSSNLLTLIETIYIWCIIFSILYTLSCCSMASPSVKKPSVYCFIDLHGTKGCLVSELLNRERRKTKWEDMLSCCFCTKRCLFTHFIGPNY